MFRNRYDIIGELRSHINSSFSFNKKGKTSGVGAGPSSAKIEVKVETEEFLVFVIKGGLTKIKIEFINMINSENCGCYQVSYSDAF